eukprot:jgi/Tetstr1/443043/TSEL_031102.t1
MSSDDDNLSLLTASEAKAAPEKAAPSEVAVAAAPAPAPVAAAAPAKAPPAKAATLAGGAKPAPSRTSARERKVVERFVVAEKAEVTELEIKQGAGKCLRDIPNVAFHLSKISGKDDTMAALHKVLYRRLGKGTTRKRDILSFSGFVYENEEEEKEKDVERLLKYSGAEIHKFMDMLDIPRGTGSKEDKVEKLHEFLLKPDATRDTDLAQKEEEKKEATRKKREREAAKKEKKAKAKAKAAKAKAAKASSKKTTKKKVVEESEEEEDSEEEEEEGEEEEAPPPKKARTPVKAPAKGKAASAPKKVATPKSATKSQTPSAAAPPTPIDWSKDDPALNKEENELRRAAIDVMKTVDLKEFSLKNLLNNLGEKFSKDVSAHKKMIKAVAVSYCTQMAT